jgi:hypothetical protein
MGGCDGAKTVFFSRLARVVLRWRRPDPMVTANKLGSKNESIVGNMFRQLIAWSTFAAGLVGLGLLTQIGYQKLLDLQEDSRAAAQESLDKAGFIFARATARGDVLMISGQAPDEQAANQSCLVAQNAVKDRLGIPGVFKEMTCDDMSYPKIGQGT